MSISLVSISNINYPLVQFSINKSLSNKKFDKVLVWTEQPLQIIQNYQSFKISEMGFVDKETGGPIPFNYDAYNIFLLKMLADYVTTDHIINIHYDGFCTNQQYWSDEFLEYDYIGSPTCRDWWPLKNTLTNHNLYNLAPSGWYNAGGGFTLRSKKLLKALQDPVIDTILSEKNFERCEDVTISVKFKEYLEKEHKIKFAPLDISMRFCTELLTGLPFSFGFHGWDNIPYFFSEDECIWYITNLKRSSLQPGHLYVRRYIAACVIMDYRKAIAHINDLLNDAEKLKIQTAYSR